MEPHTPLTEDLKHTTVNLERYITSLSAETTAFLGKFPKEIRMGLFLTDPPSKELISAYSSCVTNWNTALANADEAVAQLTRIMQKADLGLSTEIVLQCDRMLDRYLNFKTRFNFILKTGTIINTTRADLPLSDWFKQLLDFDYQTRQFIDFLKSEFLL